MTDRRLSGTTVTGAPVTFRFEGRLVTALSGDSLAAALAAVGETAFRETRQGKSRGAFCGMGVCHDCLVTVDGRAAQRACMTNVAEGMVVQRHRDRPGEVAPRPPLAEAPSGPLPEAATELAVIGAGPAGLAAAAVAAEGGAVVTLIDERPEPGGQYFKPLAEGHSHRNTDRQHRRGETWRARLAALPVMRLTGHTVWYARAEGEGFRLGLWDAGGASWLTARALILAPGAYERPALVPGWTLPGVTTIGGAQTLARRYRISPGRRLLIAGNGPLGLQLAAELTEGGALPVAVLERARPSRQPAALMAAVLTAPDLVADAARYRLALARAGVPVLEGWEVTALEGGDRVETAVAAPVDGGATRRFSVDAVALGEGFLPQGELARLLGCDAATDPATGFAVPRRDDEGATTVPGVWLAGDGGGLGGARVALAQGEIAAAAALGWLGHAAATGGARRALGRAEAFQRALRQLYQAPPRPAPAYDTILCRCETVTAGSARQAIAQGAADLGALKRITRLGMGRCQGRYCAGPAALMLAEAGHPAPPGHLFAPQVPARPVPAAALAIEKPEWGGHRRAEAVFRLPERQGDPLPARADMVIVGGGIIGVSAALRATELGFAPLVIERGTVNGEASGGNAGSLHLQLLSFDYGEKALDRGGALLQTLPLQAESIALWQELELRLGADFEIRVGGGLMLAEEAAHIRFLEAKAAAERSVGIDVQVIGRNEIAAIAPEVSPRMVAAAWCPGEGKINPLRATPALAGAARAQGARFAEHVAVTGLVREDDDFILATTAGTIRSPRLVMAAGGWTARLGEMLGLDLPVKGAPLQMIVTETAPAVAPCMLAHADRHLTMKQAEAGNLILGGAWTAGTDPATGRSRTLTDSIEGNLWVAQRVAPAVAGLHMLRTWAAMNVDIDGAPLLSALPGLPGGVVAATANGYTLGPLMGFRAAEMAAGRKVPKALERFSLARF
jgi:glycine/D-amino acid oxidase-like deaminating enzyme